MPGAVADALLIRHTDGRWLHAEILGQHRRPDGRWRIHVRYAPAPGFTFQQAFWSDDPRLRPDDEDHEQHQCRAGDEQLRREYKAARQRTLVSLHGR